MELERCINTIKDLVAFALDDANIKQFSFLVFQEDPWVFSGIFQR